MKVTEILRLVWLNLSANKSKVILTSTGIIVGAATIMLVIAIGTGGKEEVAEQFKNLNAGAIDISYEYQGNSGRPGGGSGIPGGGGGMPGGAFGGGGGFSFGGGMFMMDQSQSNSERITLSESDMEDLETFVPGIARTTMSFSTTSAVDGGELESSTSYTIAGVLSNYAGISNLEMALGDFLTDENNTYKEKVCVLGSNVAKTVFGSVYDAYDGTVYIDNRPYQVSGIISEMGTVASGISPDDANVAGDRGLSAFVASGLQLIGEIALRLDIMFANDVANDVVPLLTFSHALDTLCSRSRTITYGSDHKYLRGVCRIAQDPTKICIK